MRVTTGFRLSTYLTLILACLCLGHAEALFLPGIAWFVAPMLVLLVIAFCVEGRWALPVWAANSLGVLILFGSAVWLAYQLVGVTQPLVATVPWPVAMLPQLGPVLLVLLLVKLFRPKQQGDYWLLHGMGLLIAALACVLGGDPVFSLLLCLYAGAAIWSLTLYYFQREQARAVTSKPSALIPWRTLGLLPAMRWLLAVTAFALLLALLTPRVGEALWSPNDVLGLRKPGSHSQTGVGQEIDLNSTGQVEVNDEVVVEVLAEDAAGRPKLDLPLDQRWRGMVLDMYQNGRWLPGRTMTTGTMMRSMVGMRGRGGPGGGPGFLPGQVGRGRSGQDRGGQNPGMPDPAAMMQPPSPPRPCADRLPDIGPGQYTLTFTIRPRKAGGLFLADPVLVHPKDEVLPIVVIEPVSVGRQLFMEFNGTVSARTDPQGQCRYQQATRYLKEPDLSAPVELNFEYSQMLAVPPPESVQTWTVELLTRLAAEPVSGLRPEDLTDVPRKGLRLPRLGRDERVARALCDHLRNSGEFTYTLDLRRQDRDLDPAADFLRNVKQGNCDRYAGALALMLRAAGIPARIVKGFHGADGRGDGYYDIHNNQAHSWVEALIARPGPDGKAQTHWLALDPTPEGDPPPPPAFSLSRWWESGQRIGYEMWLTFIMDYDADEQSALFDRVVAFLTPDEGEWTPAALFTEGHRVGLWACLGLAAVASVLIWRRRQRRHAADRGPIVHCYARLLALLARHGRLRPEPAQTPREFSGVAGGYLRSLAATASLADLPGDVAALFYRIRFGGQTPSADECRAIDLRLDRLAAVLTAR
jgi:transglutaminase-like putative cysteine protease